MKYPLQKELEKDITESFNAVADAFKDGNSTAISIANKFYDAIKRINQICVDRKRY